MPIDITVNQFKEWFNSVDDYKIQELLDEGLREVILDLEQDDFFGTEGFNKRFA